LNELNSADGVNYQREFHGWRQRQDSGGAPDNSLTANAIEFAFITQRRQKLRPAMARAAQTAGKKEPFVFTSQRQFMPQLDPLQDTRGSVTYTARVARRASCSRDERREPFHPARDGDYSFRMRQRFLRTDRAGSREFAFQTTGPPHRRLR